MQQGALCSPPALAQELPNADSAEDPPESCCRTKIVIQRDHFFASRCLWETRAGTRAQAPLVRSRYKQAWPPREAALGARRRLYRLFTALFPLSGLVLGVEKCLDPRNGEQQTALGRKTASFDGSFWERDLKSNVWEARLFPV